MSAAPDIHTNTHLPGMLFDFAQKAGRECAYKLAQGWGGISLYVPRPPNLKRGHRLEIVLGRRAAEILCEMYGGEDVPIPLGPSLPPSKKTLILNLHGNGLSQRAIARKAGTTERWVFEVLKDQNLNSKQLSLL